MDFGALVIAGTYSKVRLVFHCLDSMCSEASGCPIGNILSSRCGNRSKKRSSETIPTSLRMWSSNTSFAEMAGLSCRRRRFRLLCDAVEALEAAAIVATDGMVRRGCLDEA